MESKIDPGTLPSAKMNVNETIPEVKEEPKIAQSPANEVPF